MGDGRRLARPLRGEASRCYTGVVSTEPGGGGALTGAQRQWLRGQAHALSPAVQLGRQGLSEAALRQIDAALAAHELIKVQAIVPRKEKGALAETLAERLGAEVAGVIGHVFILYRRHPDPAKRRIELPRAPGV